MPGMTAEPTTETCPSGRRRWASLSSHPLLALVLVLCLFLVPDLLSLWRNGDGMVNFDAIHISLLLLMSGAGLLVFEIACLLIRVVHGEPVKAAAHLIAILLLSATVVVGRPAHILVQYFNIYAFPGRYASCAREAAPYEAQARFRICSIVADGNSYTMIAYDSGGQIALPAGQQSTSFKNFLVVRQSPVLSQCRVAPAEALSGRFYLAEADCDRRPD